MIEINITEEIDLIKILIIFNVKLYIKKYTIKKIFLRYIVCKLYIYIYHLLKYINKYMYIQ